MKKIFRLSSIKEVLTIVVNKLKKNKRKVVIGLSAFLVVFISVFSFINLRYPTKINAYIAHVINKGEPANKYFDDENFYKAVVDAYNKENKTSLSYTTNLTDEQLKNIKSVSYSRYKKDSEKIKSATGIEKLTSLTSLDLCWNNLSSIDLSKNTSLTKLYLYQNNLSSIDLSKNTSLTNLDLDHNKISNIDLNKNIALTSLCLSFNSLSSIDLSKNTFLTTLYLDYNKISNIDLNKNTALTDLDSGNNKISNIDLNKNTSLTKLDLRYNSLSGIDLSKNTSLTKLNLYYNNLSSIDLSNNISLTSLELGNNKISNIDLNKNTSLTSLGLCENNLSSIDLNKNTSLTNLDLAHNKISSIDLSKNTSLTFLLFERNSLSSIDLSKNTALEELYLSNNNLSNIDLSKNTSLTILYFEWNSLSSIDLSKNTALTDLDLRSNNLSSIDLSKNTSLTKLYLGNNKISSIDLSKNTNLTKLELYSNNLSSIDLSNNISLTSLELGNNKISNIDLNKNTSLTKLNLYSNNLSSIDLSKNTALEELYLSNNNLSNIDLSKNTKLTTLYLLSNPLKLNAYVKEKGTLTSFSIEMPEGSDKFYLTYEIEDNSIANFTDNRLNGLKVGKTSVTVILNGVEASSSSNGNMKVDGTITVYDITSNKYKINNDKKYIYTKNDTDSNAILSNIDFQYIKGKIEDNKLILYHDDVVEEEYKIINVSSNTYDLSKDHIYDNNFNKDNISIVNGSLEEKDNTLNIKYNDEILDSKKIVKITSDKYDLTKDYIYNVNNSFDVSDIKYINCKAIYENNKLIIKYNDDVLKEIDVVSINFESSEYDLSKDYIYIGNKELDKSKFNLTNCTLQVDNSTLNIKYDNDVLKSYKLVKIYSNTYDLNKNYIYVGNGIFDKNLLSVVNGTVNVLNDKIEIKYNNDVLKEFKLLKYSSNKYDLTKEYIYLGINNFDKNNISLVNLSLNVDDNYNLNIKNGDDVMKTYKLVSVSSSKYDLSKDNIRVTKSDGLDFKDIKVTNGTKEYLNDKLYIKYNDDILKVYTISTRAKGDITGDDKITIADVSLLYRHVRKTKVITDSETLEISDLTGDGKITIADVAKLYRYVRGKITEL